MKQASIRSSSDRSSALRGRFAFLFLGLLFEFFGHPPADARAADSFAAAVNVPQISYTAAHGQQRNLIFMNNPEFLWITKDSCDLADAVAGMRRQKCGRSLFNVERLGTGSYRAWWEHRNMIPFSIHSGLLISNPTQSPARIVLQAEAVETNSFRLGGREFAKIFNAASVDKEIILAAGERRFLGSVQNERIGTGRFFAGVIDFAVTGGEVSLEEVVFRSAPAEQLAPVGYSQRTLFSVHESLVYKGISSTSAVSLTGAEFFVDDATPSGRLPVAYRHHELVPLDALESTCRPDRRPACTGSALKSLEMAQQSSSWVTHIAPDPADSNPKRKRAIVSDLIELVLPESTPSCPSAWPAEAEQCMRMSHQFFWFLPDFKKWRLPNWGNWGVHYTHPVRVKNSGTHARRVTLGMTADGASPVAYRGTGTAKEWQQIFLDPKINAGLGARVVLAEAIVEAHSEVELTGEFVLSGPGAGTLEHTVEISEILSPAGF